MNLLTLGLSFRSATVDLREKLVFDTAKRDWAIAELASRYGCETTILSTCNRVELYLAKNDGDHLPSRELLAEFLEECHKVPAKMIDPHLVERHNVEAVRHLFRVTASLDSLIVGEGQIAGQVKEAFDAGLRIGTTGPLLNTLFQSAQRAAKRVRTETGITEGHVSVSSVAVDYVKQVFDHFDDKTVLVIGAGKMGRLTLKHLHELQPKQILVTNRSPEKATTMAADCGGRAIPWEQLDAALIQADVILSTTGAPEPIMTKARYAKALAKRPRRTTVILDIAVPRDFDPAIHDGESVFLFNIDDLKNIREQTIARRRSHVDKAEAMIEEERRKYEEDHGRRKNGQVIARLTEDFDKQMAEIVNPLVERFKGKLTEAELNYMIGGFRLYKNRLLHGPISALNEAARDGSQKNLLEALKRMFRLE
ncbi:glutamyl-tRNA reductase [Zavarzinella formosa]|uniref:glutamyl-tRNA reductase n=1 Tax=Zavarzinella formosa TaxID=360055 RepID=UPI00031BC078|nr:glutamyl-tRNA reductase [Zavarzinella formosa]